MGLSNIYNRIALISPRIEVKLRKLYWKNASIFKVAAKESHKKTKTVQKHIDFTRVVDWLKANGAGEGSLLIVHSV